VLLHWRIGGSPDGKAGPHWPCYYQGVETGFNPGGDTYPKSKSPWGGYLLFARAVGDGGASIASVPSAAASPSCMGVKLWPLSVRKAGQGGEEVRETRIVVLNKKESGACRLVLRLDGDGSRRYGDAQIQWLLPGGANAGAAAGLETAAACSARSGCRGAGVGAVGEGLFSTKGDVTLGGQTMDSDGRLQPSAPRSFKVAGKRLGDDGATEFAFTLPGASGALLVVPEGGSGAAGGGSSSSGAARVLRGGGAPAP